MRYSLLCFSLTSPTLYSLGKPSLILGEGSKSTRGNKKRTKAPTAAVMESANIPQAERERKLRRDQIVFSVSVVLVPSIFFTFEHLYDCADESAEAAPSPKAMTGEGG